MTTGRRDGSSECIKLDLWLFFPVGRFVGDKLRRWYMKVNISDKHIMQHIRAHVDMVVNKRVWSILLEVFFFILFRNSFWSFRGIHPDVATGIPARVLAETHAGVLEVLFKNSGRDLSMDLLLEFHRIFLQNSKALPWNSLKSSSSHTPWDAYEDPSRFYSWISSSFFKDFSWSFCKASAPMEITSKKIFRSFLDDILYYSSWKHRPVYLLNN